MLSLQGVDIAGHHTNSRLTGLTVTPPVAGLTARDAAACQRMAHFLGVSTSTDQLTVHSKTVVGAYCGNSKVIFEHIHKHVYCCTYTAHLQTTTFTHVHTACIQFTSFYPKTSERGTDTQTRSVAMGAVG